MGFDFSFSCSQCGAVLYGKDEWIGRAASCNTCQCKLVVPPRSSKTQNPAVRYSDRSPCSPPIPTSSAGTVGEVDPVSSSSPVSREFESSRDALDDARIVDWLGSCSRSGSTGQQSTNDLEGGADSRDPQEVVVEIEKRPAQTIRHHLNNSIAKEFVVAITVSGIIAIFALMYAISQRTTMMSSGEAHRGGSAPSAGEKARSFSPPRPSDTESSFGSAMASAAPLRAAEVLYDGAAEGDVRRMAALCGLPETNVEAMTWKAQELLRANGINQSKESILTGMILVYPRSTKSVKYEECLAAYTTLRRQGRSHSEALEQFAAVLRSLGVP